MPKFATGSAVAAVMAAAAHGEPKGPPARRGPGRPPGSRNKLPAYIPAAEAASSTVPSPIGRPWSVPAWCRFMGMGRTTFYALKKQGLTPDELIVGGKHFVTPDAHQRWVRKYTVKARAQLGQPP